MGENEGGEEVGMGERHDERIFVSVRLRPLNQKEIARNDVSDWECVNDDTVIHNNASMSMPERSVYPTSYTFDRVFSCDCSTRQVYEEGAREVALSVVTGINSSIFAYGQTSSGKTFTMTGITEYTLADIYDYIQRHTEREFFLKFSAMEIYNECVRDLLSTDSTPLRLLDDPERGTIVEKLTEETLRDWNHVMELLSICETQRQIGETSLNETSSRSHQIVRLTIESSARELLGKDNSSTLVAAVNFVDLAGSERASQSLSAGTRLKEGCHINRSLLTLGTVIRKLSKGRNGHVPFRDSKLTRILQSSLGGNARTAIICTMSPARSHVEQSRNTLLFASCAKEVSTNAQVNVIISDKALVKHLQRELTRLERELRSPESTFVTSKFSALLREKDLQIEKLEKEVKDLTLQRDAAKSQVQDMVRLIGDERCSSTRLGFGCYPHLRVRRSPDAGLPVQEKSIMADPHSLEVCDGMFVRSQFFDGQSASSFNDNCVQIPGALEDNFLDNDTSSKLLISTSQFSESDSSQDSEYNDEKSIGISEDACKEVRCIETEELSTNSYLESRCLATEGDTGISALIMAKNGDTEDKEGVSPSLQEDQEVVSPPLNEDRELFSHSLKVNKEVVTSPVNGVSILASSLMKEASELSCIPSVIPSLATPSPLHDLTKELSSSRSLSLIKSTSCKLGLLISPSSPWLENVENNENTPPNGSKKEFIGRPRGLQSKVSALNYGDDVERLSREGSQSSVGTAIDIELDAQQQRTLSNENISSADTGIAEMKNVAELQHAEQTSDTPMESTATTIPAADRASQKIIIDSLANLDNLMKAKKILANETETPTDASLKRVKDVGLDPIEDGFRIPSNWPSEFKRLQREIIKLWHTCNVSLVHRSHFFLLFKGDSTDSIYMEVELRRLSFLKNTFSQGNLTMEGGRSLTPTSGLKALRNERHMLSKQMKRRFSEIERESLYLKWGVTLNGKHRRLQLVNRLWTDTEDMDHIADSAIVVAKLVGLIEPGQAFKEMFGLNFAPWSSKRTYRLKRSLISIL